MGVFGDIRGYFGGSGSVFMIIALAAADYLWGEHVFNCPCGGYRILYTCAFLIVPPVVIILIDVSWKALVSTCKQNCCCPCGEHCQEECGCCCTCEQCCSGARSTCCDYSTCETVVRLTARPVTIAVVWVIFSFIEPRFGICLLREVSCNCTEAELQNGCNISSKEKEATIRVVTSVVMLGLTAAVATILLLFLICGRCCAGILRICKNKCSRFNSCTGWCDRMNTCCQTWIETGDLKSQRGLTRSLYTLGLKPQTVIRLQEQNLMDEMLLVNLSDDAVRGIGNSISVGQLEILRKHRRDIPLTRSLHALGLNTQTVIRLQEQNLMDEMLLLNLSDDAVDEIDCSISDEQREILKKHRRDIRLVKWLLKKYSEDDIRQILEKDDLTGQTWDNVRVPLNNTDTVPDDAAANLRKELGQRHRIAPTGDGRNVSRDQKDEQDRKAETGI